MKKTILLFFLVCAIASLALAQTKVTGTCQCSKPDPMHSIAVADHEGHMLMLEQAKCTWTKPMEMAGSKSKEGSSTDSGEVDGNTTTYSGFHTSSMESGDQFFVGYKGTATAKDGKPVGSKGTWWFTSGTGKLKGIKGKGTFAGKPTDDGGVIFDVMGTYTIPAAK